MNSFITCGTVTEDSGKGVFTYAVDLTEYTGDVSLFYDTNFVPDRFIVEYNNATVIDTGYVGDKEYDSKLAALGLTTVTGPGEGVATFNKGIPEITMVYITVYAPLPFSKWSFTFGCPADLLSNTPTPTPTITLTPTSSPTVTPTLTYLPNVVNCSTITQAGAGIYKYRILASNYVNGQIKISYNTYSVPDKFTLIHGTVSSTTGYVGDAMYNSDLISLGKEVVSGPGTGVITFQIEQNIDTILIVDAPLPNTAFDFSVICPTPTPTKTPTPTITPSLSFTPTPDASPFVTPTRTPHGTPVATPPETPCPTGTPTHTPSQTTTPTPTFTQTASPSHTPPPCGTIVSGAPFSRTFTSLGSGSSPLPISSLLNDNFGRNCCPSGKVRKWLLRANQTTTFPYSNGTISDITNKIDTINNAGFLAGVTNPSTDVFNWEISSYSYSENMIIFFYCDGDTLP